MLSDIQPGRADPGMMAILSIIGRGSAAATRLDRGFYQIGHFSFNHVAGRQIVDSYELGDDDRKAMETELMSAGLAVSEADGDWSYPVEYGVCDSPEQFMAKFGPALDALPSRYVVSFTVVRKDEQEPFGGWRWHKWGPYIGEKTPACEYLYDEGPEITQATCFHVYRMRT